MMMAPTEALLAGTVLAQELKIGARAGPEAMDPQVMVAEALPQLIHPFERRLAGLQSALTVSLSKRHPSHTGWLARSLSQA
ncbi:hypothetical protein [Verminephrobacter eiseniae]|uniref:hypothetical protein n=1 Tax=Verminephrobacter eiseniae TaxID=364317 RepID=UPI002236F80A|nr:hypothetical protein [Verminephrobacter eiseniae]MCW5237965.1 hypothetical protein [Verminephrobacter eiseniae]